MNKAMVLYDNNKKLFIWHDYSAGAHYASHDELVHLIDLVLAMGWKLNEIGFTAEAHHKYAYPMLNVHQYNNIMKGRN